MRALRHYHQVGVLEEPPRLSNGYRQYDVHDLIRVLRIKRLAALGVSLEQMPPLLDETDEADATDEPGDQRAGLLDQLDQELAARIDALTAQRALIADLRDAKAAPDLPPELAQFFTTYAAGGLSDAMARLDRDQTVLLAHLVGAAGMPDLVNLDARISDPDLLPAVTRGAAQFDSLTTDTTADELHRFVDEFVSAFTPIIRELNATAPDFGRTGAAALLAEYTADVLNSTQQRALDLIGARLDDVD